MALRFFSSTAPDTALDGAINDTTNTVNVGSVAGYPVQFPYTIAVSVETSAEELMDVTAAAGLTLTVIRGVDGAVPLSHNNGDIVRHVASGRDFREANTHVNAIDNAHGVGVGSDVVGTNTAQTLAQKTYSGGVLTGTLDAAAAVFSGSPNFTGGPDFHGATVGDNALRTAVAGDAAPRLAHRADGRLIWGDGAVAGDTNLYRSGVNALKTDDSFEAAGGIANTSINGAALSGTFTGAPTFTGNPEFERATATDEAVGVRVAGDADSRLEIRADGRLVWGDGTASDTNLYRTAANVLHTDDSLEIGGTLKVSGSAMVAKRAVETASQTGLTNVSYEAPPLGAGFSFVAPPSGCGTLSAHARIRVTTTANVERQALIAPRLGTGGAIGGGTPVIAPFDNWAVNVFRDNSDGIGVSQLGASIVDVVIGLTPGNTYNVELQGRINSGTSASYDIFSLILGWVPCV